MYRRIQDLNDFPNRNKRKQDRLNKVVSSYFKEKMEYLSRLSSQKKFLKKIGESIDFTQTDKIIPVLNDIVTQGFIKDFVMGGGAAVAYYSLPTQTDDVDFFLSFKVEPVFLDLSPVLNYLIETYGAKYDGDHILLFGIPIQFLVPGDKLSEEAFNKTNFVEEIGCKIMKLEYLVAIMLQLNKPKYRMRVAYIKEEKKYDEVLLNKILKEYNLLDVFNKIGTW